MLNQIFVKYRNISTKQIKSLVSNFIAFENENIKKVSCVGESNNIYSFPITERKNKFLELLSQTKGDTKTSIRRGKILKEMRENLK